MNYDTWKTTDPTDFDREERIEEPEYAPPERIEPAPPPAPNAPAERPLAVGVA